jgi:hypothetical protein
MPGHHTISRTSLIGASAAAAAAVLGLLLALPSAPAQAVPGKGSARVAVGAQYDTTHVYVQHGTAKAFVASWEATFGGTNTTPVITDVTPTPSKTLSELVLSPVGTLSVFDFQTGIPDPFGQERGGDLVSDFSEGVADAVHSGAYLAVSPWDDPIGKDAIVQFPAGVDIQLYWHATAPSYAPLATIPESRVYLDPQAADAFIRDYLAFSRGRIALDDSHADGGEIGLPGTYRKVLITSGFGETLVIITNGHLPYPFGREATGYAVTNLAATLAKAKAAGARILWGPYYGPDLDTAILQFPGGYIAEVHMPTVSQAGSPGA